LRLRAFALNRVLKKHLAFPFELNRVLKNTLRSPLRENVSQKTLSLQKKMSRKSAFILALDLLTLAVSLKYGVNILPSCNDMG